MRDGVFLGSGIVSEMMDEVNIVKSWLFFLEMRFSSPIPAL